MPKFIKRLIAVAAVAVGAIVPVALADSNPPVADAALTNCSITYYIGSGQAAGVCTGSTNYAPYTTQGAFFVECRQPRPYSGRQWATSGWLNKNVTGRVYCGTFGAGWYPITGSGYWVFR